MKNLGVRALLLVENNGYPFDVRVRREALALHKAGCKVSVVAPKAKDQPWREILDGVHVYRYPAPPNASGVLSYAFEFGYSTFAMLCVSLWVALRRGVNVVHAANPPDTLFVVALVLKCFGARFVFDHHDLSPETYLSRFPRARRSLVYRALRLLERCTFATADVVISTNESYRQVAIERGGMAPDKVFVVRNGPPLSYQPVEPDPALADRAKFLIGYIGTMGPQDGVDYLLRAIRKLVTELGRRDFLTVVIGTGDAEPDLRALARQLDIEPYIWFTGRIPDAQVKTILSSVHVCVQPDPFSPLNDESTMNKMMEYMALGKPTVAFDLKETRVSAADAAVYVSGNDELEFARQIGALFDDPTRRARMGAIGRQRVASQLAWEFSEHELVRAYSDGLGLSLRAASAAASTAAS